MRDIGKNIRQLRVDKQLTQEDLAERLFVTRQTVSNYESGRSRPDVEMLEQIAQALETDVSALLYGPHISTPEERRRRTLCWFELGAAAVLVVVGRIGIQAAQDYGNQHYDMVPTLLIKYLLFPLILAFLGFAALDGLLLFLRPAPLRRSLALGIRWIALAILCGFASIQLINIVPLMLTGRGINFGAFLNDFLWKFMALLGNQPWLMLFPGAALRLGFHLKKTEKRV